MKQETKQETKPKRKTTKATIRRITALLLALLLTITVSPATTAFADGSSTHEGSSGAEHGGSSGSFGDDTDDSSQLISPPSLIINDDGTRTLNLKQSASLLNGTDIVSGASSRIEITGSGRFVIRSFYWHYDHTDKIKKYGILCYLFSDKPFDYKATLTPLGAGTAMTINDKSLSYKNIYYVQLPSGISGSYDIKKEENYNFSCSGFANVKHLSSDTHPTAQQLIDSGDLDLEKDDYIPEDQIGKLTPVKDDSIGYLPRARYFDNRRNHSNLRKVTSTIQWASFEEPYCSDLDNPYYVEIYANVHCLISHEDEHNPGLWITDNVPLEAKYQYKKYGELKYVNERFEFSYSDPFDYYLSTVDLGYSNVNVVFPQSYVSAYYVRLLHYDYDKQQLLCGGWTKLVPNDNGGCTSSTGDFNPDDPDDFVDDDDDPKDWGDDGWEPDPTPPNPDDPDDDDFGIDTSNIGAFILSAITSLLNAFKKILLLVGEFPDLCKHVFSFLPDEVSTMMFGGVAAIVVMRFLGR